MRRKSILAVMLVASVLTINAFPVNAAGANSASLGEKEALKSERAVESGQITKSEFMYELKNIKEEFPEADINVQLAEKEFDEAIIKQNLSQIEDVMSDLAKEPKGVYTKVKDDGTMSTLTVYSDTSWETKERILGTCTGNYYSGTTCKVKHINSCTSWCVSFKVDHTTSHVDRTYGLLVGGIPDFSMGLGASITTRSGSTAKVYVNGIERTTGLQLFHGTITFRAYGFTLSTSYVWD